VETTLLPLTIPLARLSVPLPLSGVLRAIWHLRLHLMIHGGYPVPQVPPVPIPVAPAGYAPVQNMKDNPPCNTLFIGNLGESTSETELRGLFSGQPGFRQMKVLRQGRSTVCFIEFEDLHSAVAVHNNLQGAVLTSSDRGGMRIQYSKNPFGRKKDSSGPMGHAVDGAPGVPLADINGVSSSASQ